MARGSMSDIDGADIEGLALTSGGTTWVTSPASRLLAARMRRRICVVTAAAGWGKSTLVSHRLRQAAVPSALVRCDRVAAGQLAGRLHDALEPFLTAPAPRPSAGGRPDDLLEEVATLARRWEDDLPDADVTLVLDDLQAFAPGSLAARCVETLCMKAPDRLRLVLVSSRDLPFALHRLRGQGSVAEIDATELALDPAAITELLQVTLGDADPALARRLHHTTGGWPAAVCWALERMHHTSPEQRDYILDSLVRPGERLRAYVRDEVIAREAPAVQALLGQLDALGGVDRQTAGVLGVDHPLEALRDLTRRGLVEHDSVSDRFSPACLVREVVADDLAAPPDVRAELHRAVAGICVEHDRHGEALAHLLTAGDHDAAVSLLLSHGERLVARGHGEAVLRMSALPEEHLRRPELQQILGHAQHSGGDLTSAAEAFRRAGAGRDELTAALSWRAALVAFAQAEYTHVLELCARTELTGAKPRDEARMLALAASAQRMVGDYAAGRASLDRAAVSARVARDPSTDIAVLTARGLLDAAEGDRWSAQEALSRAVAIAERTGNRHSRLELSVHRAWQLMEEGWPEQALTEADTALARAGTVRTPAAVAHALHVRGMARTQLADLDLAAADLEQAYTIFSEIGSRQAAWALGGLADLHRLRGRLARARAGYEAALSLAEPAGDVLGTGSALIGLARTLATEDPTRAADLAERAVSLGERFLHVPALLTRGWVALGRGDRSGACSAADEAAKAARAWQYEPGLAEALVLGAVAARRPVDSTLMEAIAILREREFRLKTCQTRMVAAQLFGSVTDSDAAAEELRQIGIGPGPHAAGLLAAAAQSAPAVEIHTFGAFQVLRDRTAIPKAQWRSKKARDLLKILVCRRRPVPRDQLMELLWPESDPARSGNRLSVLISNLRDVLGPEASTERDLVATDGGAVRLDYSLVRVDIEDFLVTAHAALETHRRDEHDATARLAEAEARMTGQFMEDDPYQEWAESLANEIQATHIALLRALTARLRQSGDVDRATHYLLRLLRQDPYDERAHLDLVSMQRNAGHLGEARRHYQMYARRMTELGVDPEPFPAAPRKDTSLSKH